MDTGLYLHFPFCARKCRYCDFLSFPADEDTKRIYAAAMIREIRAYADTLKNRKIDTIFLGGGTPSVMPAGSLRDIMRAVCDSFDVLPDAEITMEINPGTLHAHLLPFICDYVNRVSLGVQSAVDEELKFLGRIHSREDAEKSFGLLRDAGIRNISLDLMSAIPGQTEESFRESLAFAAGLKPEHISCYSLIVEEGTEFYRLQKEGKLHLPDEDTERRMYGFAGEFLEDAGYSRYEISNYARDGFRCRHNVRYWKRADYIGFGIGAASLFEHTRWRNTRSLEHYFEDSADPRRIVREMEQLDLKSEVEEFMFLGLRMREGISKREFREKFSLGFDDVYGDVCEEMVREGMIVCEGDVVRLTGRGTDVSNRVMAEFLL